MNLTIPIIYGNPERWKAIKKDGYLRDPKGQIQIPLIMFKRNTIDRDSDMQLFNRHVTYPSIQKYSTKIQLANNLC